MEKKANREREKKIKAANGIGPGVGPSVRQVVMARLMKKSKKEAKDNEARTKR